MSYQRVTGPLMANSHPGSYCGQDAYNDMFVTEEHGTMGNGNRTGKCRNNVGGVPTLNANHEQPITGKDTSTVVRRLTPQECYSLQGFPRNWCDIGDWVDSKGKLHKDADSPKYKAIGNSIAVGYDNNQSGFWCWLARRICAEYEHQVTMGSLFDGIGGFPLAFTAAGARAVWASEIEEFPIAVTKIRFPEGET